MTVGPNTEPSKATNVGEAAHIFGAKSGSARYRAVMTDSERSVITNAIWLCRDCHALIDRDERRYPAELLIQWKATQEENVLRELGKPGELLRLQLLRRESEKWSDVPSFAKQVIEDKPDLWEFIVAVELLDFYLKVPLSRANQLKKGLYTKPKVVVGIDDFVEWIQTRLAELMDEVNCLKQLLSELTAAFGEEGVPGIPSEIVDTCRLFGMCAQRFVDIAEQARFVQLPEEFEDVGRHFAVGALHVTSRFPEISAFIRSIMELPDPQGVHQMTLVIDLPEGWSEGFDSLFKDGTEALLAGRS